MSEPSGHKSSEPFAYFVHESSAWRTSQLSLDLSFTESPIRFPRSGMTSRGLAYELPTLELLTGASASSSLLPTPVVNDMGDGKTVEWWDEWTARMKAKTGNGNGHGNSLAIEVQRSRVE